MQRQQPAAAGSWLYWNVIAALGFAGAAFVGVGLGPALAKTAAIWPATGVAMAALLTCGGVVAPGLFLADFGVLAVLGFAMPQALAIAAAVTAGPAVAGWILRRMGLDLALDSLNAIGRYAAIACTQAVLVAVVGAAILAGSWKAAGDLWSQWAMANCLAMLSVTPLLVWLHHMPVERRWSGKPQVFWLCVIGLMMLAAFCFAQRPSLGYPVLLAVMLIAVRHYQFETSLAALAAAVTALVDVMYRSRLPLPGAPSPTPQVLNFLAFMSAGALLLGGLVAEGRRREAALLAANQARLAQSETRFEDAFEAAAQGMGIVALDGHWLRVNAALCRMLGYSADEMLVRTFQSMTHPDDIAQDDEFIRGMMAGEISTIQFEKRYVHKSGRVVLVMLSVSLVRDSVGEPLNYVCQVMDITDRKQAEELWRFGLENAGDVVWEWDVPAERLNFSSKIGELVGEGVRLGRLQDWRVLIHSDDLARVQNATGDLINVPGHHYHAEYRVRRNDGTWRWVLSRGMVTARDQQDRAMRAIGTIADITDVRRLQDKLHQSDKMAALGQLSSGVAHDVNNDLGVIVGSAEMILEQAGSGLRDAALASRIISTVRRSRDLVRRMLAFSRQADIVSEPLEMAAFLRGFVDTLGRTLGAHILIRIAVEDPPFWVSLDRSVLESSLINLSINARDAMPGGGSLTFALSREDGSVLLSVADTGAGMSEEVQQHIFEPFFTTKPVSGGTGLGLAMVYGFVEQSGGHIEVESKVGQGTRFLLRFPAATAPVEAAPRIVRPGACRVLLVEDNDTLRQTLREQLVSLRCTVVEARDFAQAVAIADADDRIGFLLTDYDLGAGPDGMALAAWARTHHARLPGAIMSGHLKSAGELPSGWQSVQKPVQLAGLKALLGVVGDAPAGAGAPLILVVEDHDDMRFVAVEILKRRGYGTLEAANATEALAQLKDNPAITLVLSDVGLPDMPGRQLADEARKLRPGLEVLLMSGSLSHRAYGAGDQQVLQKPFSRDSLTRFVEDALARTTTS